MGLGLAGEMWVLCVSRKGGERRGKVGGKKKRRAEKVKGNGKRLGAWDEV